MSMPGRNDPCWCGSGAKYKKCHMDFDRKLHEFELAGAEVPPHSLLKTPEQLEGIADRVRLLRDGEGLLRHPEHLLLQGGKWDKALSGKNRWLLCSREDRGQVSFLPSS